MLEVEKFEKTISCIKTASSLGKEAIMWVYAYQVGNVVFDAGCANAIKELQGHKAEFPVDRVFVTHNHEDHYGGCGGFLPSATIFARPATMQTIKKPFRLNEFFRFVWGQPEPVKQVKMMPDSFRVDKYHFEVVDLSGHCLEMVGFWEADQGWLFASDAVPLPSRKMIAMLEENVPMMIQRMKEIQALDVKILFDAHRGPVPNPRAHIQTRIDFLVELKDQVFSLHQEGLSIQEIKKTLGFAEPWYLSNTEGRFAIDHLIRSLLEDQPYK